MEKWRVGTYKQIDGKIRYDVGVRQSITMDIEQEDAELIVTMQNQCWKINPEHPELVAEKITSVIKMLDRIYNEKCMRPLPGGEIPFEWAICEKTITELRTLLFEIGLCNNPINLTRDELLSDMEVLK